MLSQNTNCNVWRCQSTVFSRLGTFVQALFTVDAFHIGILCLHASDTASSWVLNSGQHMLGATLTAV
jgi:hypothetical protein